MTTRWPLSAVSRDMVTIPTYIPECLVQAVNIQRSSTSATLLPELDDPLTHQRAVSGPLKVIIVIFRVVGTSAAAGDLQGRNEGEYGVILRLIDPFDRAGAR